MNEVIKTDDVFRLAELVSYQEGKDTPIKAGENFHFAKGGLHSIQAAKRFKMGLLLILE